ncbi:MAG: transposase, partial [Deltaproteobacteria bacterium]|nr:transposase [Deltaproteobacteria bacterium]
LHKPSRSTAKTSDAVAIEDLDMQGLARALNSGKSVGDDGWGMLVSMLGYKLGEQGKRLVVAARSFPPGRACSRCGHVKDSLGLSERTYACERCGHVLDRDWNAALDIRREGLRMLGLPEDENRGIRGVSPDADLAGPRRLEREAPTSNA